MQFREYLTPHGSVSKLARALNKSPAEISMYKSGRRPIPIELGAAIENATGGAVTRQEMFPDTWQSIWPELCARND